MALRRPNPEPDDPRLTEHQTVYSPSRGGHYPPTPKPVPGTPKKESKR